MNNKYIIESNVDQIVLVKLALAEIIRERKKLLKLSPVAKTSIKREIKNIEKFLAALKNREFIIRGKKR